MVRIRLTRVGLKKQPSYRIVVIDSKSGRDSRYIESIGFYNPRTQPETVTVQEDRALYWLSVGAQPSDPVKQLFRKCGTQGRFERMKAGEDLTGLLAEAVTAAEANKVSAKTRYPAPAKSAQKAADAVALAAEGVGGEE